jgi:ABC-type Fe3+/spermidine/putrescine transport system ATPase subunit
MRAAVEPAPAGRPAVEGQVESTLYLGTATQAVVRLKDGTAMSVLVPNSDDAERQRLPGAGAQVRLTWADEHIHMVRETEGGDPE